MVRISCHSRNYSYQTNDTPDQTLWFIRKLGFDYVTLDASTFSPDIAAANPSDAAAACRDLMARYELKPVEYVPSTMDDDGKACTAVDYDPAHEDRIADHFAKICRFSQQAGFGSVMLVTGDIRKDEGYQVGFDKAVRIFTRLSKIAKDEGVLLNIEPGQRSIIQTPDQALELVKAVPGIGLTLDPLQWQVHGYDSAQTMRLLPYSNHMHARQAAEGWNKCPLEFGEIDYDLILKRMRGAHWDGTITMEFWLTDAERFGNMSPVDQTIVLRYQIKQLIRKYWSDTVMPL